MDAEHGVISSRTLRIGYLLGMTLWVFRACFINQMDYALFGFDLRILFFYFFSFSFGLWWTSCFSLSRIYRSISPILVVLLLLFAAPAGLCTRLNGTLPKDRQAYEWDVTLQSYVSAIKAPSTWAAVKHYPVTIFYGLLCGFIGPTLFSWGYGLYSLWWRGLIYNLKIDILWLVTECDACSLRTSRNVLDFFK